MWLLIKNLRVLDRWDLNWDTFKKKVNQFMIQILEKVLLSQESTLSFPAGCLKNYFLGWYRNFLVYWYLKLDNQVVNSTCPKDKIGWIWQADDP